MLTTAYMQMPRREWMQAAAQHAHEQMAKAPGARKVRYFTAAEATEFPPYTDDDHIKSLRVTTL